MRGLFCLILLTMALPLGAQVDVPKLVPKPVKEVAYEKELDSKAAQASLERAVDWLIKTQRKDGSWAHGVITGLIDSGYSIESFYDWKMSACALAVMALRRVPETKARRQALDRSLHWLSTARAPRRGSDWDVDSNWAVLYGVIALVECAEDPRFQDDKVRKPMMTRLRLFLRMLKKNQSPKGGWAYYDNKPYSQRPTWGTSFCTAAILPALKKAIAKEWYLDKKSFDLAYRYVERCRLPNQAIEYDLNPIPRAPSGEHINKVKGSLSRIQVANWGMRSVGDPKTTDERIRWGLEAFFRHHRFLDIARMRPIPHEAYYANAGYFYFFGHFYAGEVIEQLPMKEREAWHRKLRAEIVKTQRKDGSFCDFIGQDYMVVADTAYAIMSLQAGLR